MQRSDFSRVLGRARSPPLRRPKKRTLPGEATHVYWIYWVDRSVIIPAKNGVYGEKTAARRCIQPGAHQDEAAQGGGIALVSAEPAIT